MDTKIFNIQQSKIHNVWHPNKKVPGMQNAENTIQNEEKNQSKIKADLKNNKQMIEFYIQ